MTSSVRQYKREVQIVVGKNGQGISITASGASPRRVTFEIVKDHQANPNQATIKVYNLNDADQHKVRYEYDEIMVNAGYEGAAGMIFRGNIKHVYRYREGNDWIVQIDAGDGDFDFRNAVINESFAAGVSDATLIDRICGTFSTTKKGAVQGVASSGRVRGKVVSGNSRTVLNDLALQNDCNWSIQDGQLQIIPAKGYLDSEVVVVNATTGMLGVPEQDDKGVKINILMNPLLRINGRVKLDNDNIKRKQIDPMLEKEREEDAQKTPSMLDPEGIYKIYKITHKGDTRGQEWVSKIETVSLDSAFPVKK